MPRRDSRVEATIKRLADQAAKREAAVAEDARERAKVRNTSHDAVPPMSPSRLTDLAKRADDEPQGAFKIDKLGLSWGRAALADAAWVAARAAWRHAMDADRSDRDAELREAIGDALAAISRARTLANLLVDLHAAGEAYEREARKILERPIPKAKGKGSPGRPVQDAVRNAVKSRWERETARSLPKALDPDRHADVLNLLKAISEDIFGHGGAVGGRGRRPANKSAR